MPETLSEVLKKMTNSFEGDPPETERQLGYLEAIIEIGHKFQVSLPYTRLEPLVKGRRPQ